MEELFDEYRAQFAGFTAEQKQFEIQRLADLNLKPWTFKIMELLIIQA